MKQILIIANESAFFWRYLNPYGIGSGQESFLVKIHENCQTVEMSLDRPGSIDIDSCTISRSHISSADYVESENEISKKRSKFSLSVVN